MNSATTATVNFSQVGNTQSIAYHAWYEGKIVRVYITPPVRTKRKLGVNEYSARVEIDGKSVYGKCCQDADMKLFFVKN